MADSSKPNGPAYEVMARRYRPQNFDDLIGQEFLVRVLTNAFEREQIPHAIMLTGVRGVGKTTTARIVAKGLNCLESQKPTIQPCGECTNCRAIAHSRHIDVLEMDAASRTSINDIREIIDGIAYSPAESRYKVYIIDEVHMLSKSAFNGLLKTLEEPPSHVIFILATTDIEKVPVTVLSRCMRFDLRRIEPAVMAAHLTNILEKEAVAFSPEAVRLIARGASGSVRDALSLLDQAVAHSGEEGLTEAGIRSMMGMADLMAVFELFECVMQGEAAAAVTRLNKLYQAGAEAEGIVKDLGQICHLITVVKTVPERLNAPDLSQAEQEAARLAAEKYDIRELGRLWQMILKALEELKIAPSSLAAAEMALIRMTHISTLPTPAELIQRLSTNAPNTTTNPPKPTAPRSSFTTAPSSVASQPSVQMPPVHVPLGAPAPNTESQAHHIEPQAHQPKPPNSFEDILALLRQKRDAKLLFQVEQYIRPGPCSVGSFEFSPAPNAPKTLAADLAQRLTSWTGQRWLVLVADGHTTPTIAEKNADEADALKREALAHPLVQAMMEAFPGAEITELNHVNTSSIGAANDDDIFEASAEIE